MTKSRALFALGLALVFSPGFIVPLTAAEPAPAEETELAREMSTMSGIWRKLRRQVADPASNASSIELTAKLKIASEKSATLIPERAQDLPAADRARFVEKYQTKMKEFLAQLDQLAAAFKANDNAAAATLVKKMGDLQRDGHKEFQRPEH